MILNAWESVTVRTESYIHIKSVAVCIIVYGIYNIYAYILYGVNRNNIQDVCRVKVYKNIYMCIQFIEKKINFIVKFIKFSEISNVNL